MAMDMDMDYQEIVDAVKKFVNYGDTVQQNVKSAWQEFENMSSSWGGNSYNTLVTSVNSANDKLNNRFNKIMVTLPAELHAKAQSYASVDQVTLANFSEPTVVTLTDIPTIDKGTTITFSSSGVTSSRDAIINYFDTAKDAIAEAMDLATNLRQTWNDAEGDKNLSKLREAYRNIKQQLVDIQTVLKKAVTAQINTQAIITAATDVVTAASDAISDSVEDVVDDVTITASKFEEAADAVWTIFTS